MAGTAAAAPAATPQNALMSFFWGPNGQKLTPQQAAANQEVANAMILRQGAPKNVGEGLSAIGQALIAKDMRDRGMAAQSEGLAKATADFPGVMQDPNKAVDFLANDAFASPAQQSIVQAVMAQRMQLTNPMAIGQLANLTADTGLKTAQAGALSSGGQAMGAPVQDAQGNYYIPTQYGGVMRPLTTPGAGGAPASQPADTSAAPPPPPPAAIISPPIAPAPLPPAGGLSSVAPAGQPGKFLTPAQQKEAEAEGTALGTYKGDLPKLRNTMMSENRDINQGYAVNTNLINKAINLINSTNPNDLFDQNTGMGSYLTAVKGSKAYDLQQILSSIGGAEMLNKIAQMKDDSSNGASGISRVTQMEAQMMQGLNGSLSQAQSRDQLLASLVGAKSQMASAASLRAHAFQDTFGQPLTASPDDPFAAPGATIASMPGGIPTVTSLEEAKSLPSGTKFYDPQMVLRQVP